MTQVKQRAAKDADPMGRLKGEAAGFVQALGDRALGSVREKVTSSAGRLLDYANNGGGSGLMAAATGVRQLAEGKSRGRALLGAAGKAVGGLLGRVSGKGGRGGRGKKLKVTNIVEQIDVGVPLRLAYDQWTQFTDFPSFMKKVENVEQKSDEELNWKAQIFWSHRNWSSTIKRQVPDETIIWTSKGQKGHVDGAVSFHEISPKLTRILVVLEYHPQGGFEHIGNLWRAQGRRVRLELKHYRRHVMTQAALRPDEIKGWRGVIEDGEVVKDHQTALRDEQQGEEPQDYADDEEAGYDEEGEDNEVSGKEYEYSGRRE
ncbi:MAG TPA: SRPBCC family protein [Streptosporangiaceae bacterium]|nr:SRPBCC family protein [Streptosporangiaceae bacterium]